MWNMVFSGVTGAPGAELPQPADDHAGHHPDLAGRARTSTSTPPATTTCSCRQPADQRVRRQLGQRHHPGHLAADEPVLRGHPVRHRRADQRGPGAGLQPVLHPGRLQHQPDDQRHQPEHRRARHRLPDPHPDRRREHHAGRRRGRRADRGPAVRRRHHQLQHAADQVGPARLEREPRGQPDLGPGRRSSASAATSRARPPTAWSSTPTTPSSTTSGPGAPTTATRAPSAGPSTRPTHGLVVNGNNVLATGLFVEHYQNYEVQWNGNGGETIFFQNEMPYDPPNQAAWMNGSSDGYAAYEVGAERHHPRGLRARQLLLLQRQPGGGRGPRLRGARPDPASSSTTCSPSPWAASARSSTSSTRPAGRPRPTPPRSDVTSYP